MGEGGAGLVIMEGGGVGGAPPRMRWKLRGLVPPWDDALLLLPRLLLPQTTTRWRRRATASLQGLEVEGVRRSNREEQAP